MMNFPSPPTPGQIYAAPGGPVYRFDDPVWTAVTAADIDVIAPRPPATVSPFDFGGKGDGITDDRLAIQQAIDYLFNTFRSGTVDMSGGRWLVDSADIQMRAGVYLVGSWRNAGNDETGGGAPGGLGPMHFEQFKSCIVINPLYTIKFYPYDSCGLKGLVLLRKGLLTVPSGNPRAANDAVRAFAGVAVTVDVVPTPSGNCGRDTYFGYCFVAGFEFAYKSTGSDRMHIEYIQGDCTNGIYIKNCYDVQHVSHCHFWPFVTSNGSQASYAVSGAVNNGSGLVRLTTLAHVLTTGDTIVVDAVGGVPNAQGKWVVTVINTTTIDLQGSSFAGAYTSGGTVYFPTYMRHGSAYWFDTNVDWGQMDHCFSFGWDIGFNMVDFDHGELLNCGSDNNVTNKDPTAIGFRIKDCSAMKMIGCKSAASAFGVVVDLGAAHSMSITQHDAWGIQDICIYVISGYAMITGTQLSPLTAATRGIVVDPTADGVYVTGCRNNGGFDISKIINVTGDALRKSMIINNSWADNSGIGERWVNSYGNAGRYKAYYHDSPASALEIYQKARGTVFTPLAAQTGDASMHLRAEFWDGIDQFRPGGSYRIQANSAINAASVGTSHYWSAVQSGQIANTDRMFMQYNALSPTTDNIMVLGFPNIHWANVITTFLSLKDGVAEPAPYTGDAALFVVSGKILKIKFSDGTVKTVTLT